MASVPGYSVSSRGSRPSEGSTSTARDETSAQPISRATESTEDTETLVLNKSDLSSSKTHAAVDPSDYEPRRCWICYTDETEESPLNSEWRSPCPCALTAHEACLLDWLADLENPRSRRRNDGGAKMVCPQCKTEIVVSRPRSYIVDVLRLVERIAGRMVLPGMVFTLAGTVWAGCCAHGVYSMYFVFGTEEARQIIEETAELGWSPGLGLGLPLIPLVLIFSRTRYAEGLLPAIPVLFFATQHPGQEPNLDFWPPGPGMVFAALPYVNSFYSAMYERLFGRMERRWIAEVQPRAVDNVNEFDDNAPPHEQEADQRAREARDGQVVMEIDLELQMGTGNGDDNGPQAALGLNGAQNQQQQQDGGDAGEQNQEAENGQGLGLGRRQGDIIHETSNLADVVLGALVFPAISASMGSLLKYILPKSWTTAQLSLLDRGKPGLLQTRWGRSVVGGCAFVLLKDVILLYCRWKLAQTHRKRKILNYDKSKKQVAGNKR